MNNGSVDNLKVSSTHGLSPNAFQIRDTVGWDIPVAFGHRPGRPVPQGAWLVDGVTRVVRDASGDVVVAEGGRIRRGICAELAQPKSRH